MSKVKNEDRVFRVYNKNNKEHRAIKGVDKLARHIKIEASTIGDTRLHNFKVGQYSVTESDIPWTMTRIPK